MLLLLAACTAPKSEDSAPTVSPGPDITFSPGEVAFGEVPVGRAATTLVTLTNEGDESLQIHVVTLDSDGREPFALSAVESVLVPPGLSTTFEVTFAPPEATSYADTIEIETNDPDAMLTEIPVSGTGIASAAQLSIEPASIDFGTLYVGCADEIPVSLTSTGGEDVTVTDLSLATTDPSLTLDSAVDLNGPLPWRLAPRESAVVYLDFDATSEPPVSGVLTVTSDDPAAPATSVAVTGAGAIYGENLDVYTQFDPDDAAFDFVFAVDTSANMVDAVDTLAGSFDALADALDATPYDWRVAAVVDDDGCVNGDVPYLDRTMDRADQEDAWRAMLLAEDADEYAEMGFSQLEAALSPSNMGSGGCNDGVVRAGSNLRLVGFTNEVEQSANPWSYYVSLFQGIDRAVVMNAIAGDYPSGCEDAEPGQGWYEASVATRGAFLSICDDLEDTLASLVEADEPLDQFELSSWPVPETIEVTVDGVPQTTGWIYDAADNTVDFDDPPSPGARIEVAYVLYGECE